MAEWLYEDGIGEARAALIDQGAIVEARIERTETLRAGTTLPARLLRAQGGTRRAIVRLADGTEALLDGAPNGLSEGAALRVTIVREAISEEGRTRPPTAIPAHDDVADGPGPPLRTRIANTRVPVRTLAAHQPDALEAAGWSEVLAGAESGLLTFPGGLLRLSLTPAMALFDVDGAEAPDPLAIAGATAAARAIRLLDITGSIGIDLPTVAKPARAAAAAALDAALPPPFERTAVNGFGFLQLIRRRTRASLAELVQGDRSTAAALALLRRAERTPGHGTRTIVAAPRVIARLAAAPGWTEALARRLGVAVALRADATLAISGGHVAADRP